MKPYQYQPIDGILNLKKEDYKGVDLLKALEKVEEDISPIPQGRAKRLMLFFYLINIMKNSGVVFCVKGGLILQYYLKDHSRPSNDIDLLVPNDADIFYVSAKQAFANNQYGLDIQINDYRKDEPSKKYYFSTFNMKLTISYQGKQLDIIHLEGICSELFYKVTKKEYPVPIIIEGNSSFPGVTLEYMFADKLLVVTSELVRPFKHLVDAYSISHLNVDVEELKRYLEIILSFENIERKKLGIPLEEYQYEIRLDKKFKQTYYFPMIQAGYILPSEEMVQSLNQYMASHLK